jgi:predicted RNA-binding protein YlxR (DUF448 family)
MTAAVIHEAREAQQAAPGRAAVDDDRAVPLRRCIVTRDVRPRAELLRLVVAPDGTVVADIEGRLPGRGLWITPRRDIVADALRRNLIAKAAKRAVVAPADLADRIEAGLARRCLDLLGLARRAGQSVAGFEKVRGWLKDGKAALLVEASDGAADGRRKLQEAAGGRVPTVTAVTAAELAAALGRETAVHVAVAHGPLAERLRLAALRLAEMRDHADGGETKDSERRQQQSRAAQARGAATAAGDALAEQRNDRNRT